MTTVQMERKRSVAEQGQVLREIPGSRSPEPWWTGVWGLDPALPPKDIMFAASSAAMACAAHALDINVTRKWLQGRIEVIDQAEAWFNWLANAAGEAEAMLRRLALRVMCDTDIEPKNILPSAEKLLRACTPKGR